MFLKRNSWLWFLTLIVSVIDKKESDKKESAQFLLSLTTIDSVGWAVGRMMLFESLVLAEKLGGTRRLILTSLILTTAEVAAEFLASLLTPKIYILFKREALRSRNLSRFALQVYGISSRLGLFAYSILGLLIYTFQIVRNEISLILLAATQTIQYSFMNQIGDQCVELSKPHWLPTFETIDLGLFNGCFMRKQTDARVLSLFLSILRISLSLILSGIYVALRSSPPARFASVAFLCLMTVLASYDLLSQKSGSSDVASGIVDQSCVADDSSSFPWPWHMPTLDLKLITFSLCAFSLPEQALNALVALLVLRLSPTAYGVVIVIGVVATITYFIRALKNSNNDNQSSIPRFTSWILLIVASLVGLAVSAFLLFIASTSQLLFTVVPALCLFVVAQWALRAQFTEFLFLMDQARSSAVVYYVNVFYVLASGPLLILNWILVQQVRGSDYAQVAVLVIAAGGLFFFAAIILAFQTDLRDFVNAHVDTTAKFVNSNSNASEDDDKEEIITKN
mmetsp:Transcript_11849/g.17742  ORF Transcript_11849/g.17742 Transcript_11849/m.17742 type:complete len:509 (-) Transcript_11849:68-1594(-)